MEFLDPLEAEKLKKTKSAYSFAGPPALFYEFFGTTVHSMID